MMKHDERRRDTRFEDVKEVVVTQIFPSQEEQVITQTRDISASGLRYSSPREIPVGALIKVELEIHEKPVVLMGQVRWQKQTDTHHEAGVEFVNVADDPVLKTYLGQLEHKTNQEDGEKLIFVKFLRSPHAPALEGQTFYCKPRDMCEDGLMLKILDKPAMSSSVAMRIDLSTPPIRFKQKGEVAWIKRIGNTKEYRLGIQFQDMKNSARTVWSHALFGMGFNKADKVKTAQFKPD